TGPDAQTLLSDVLTAKIPQEKNTANWWAFLSPQGKIQAEGLIGLHQDAFWLDVSSDISSIFLRRMSMYKLRAKATIEDVSETHMVGFSATDPNIEGMICHQDGRHFDLGFRVISVNSITRGWRQDEKSANENRVRSGIAELGRDFESDRFFPHDIAMDLLQGIDFSKGCYVGQEVVSRMRHRGNVRRRPVIIELEQAIAGDEIVQNGKTVGTIGAVVDGHAVGIVRLDRISNPRQLEVNNHRVIAKIPAWADYDFAGVPNPDK
ncbi:MAG: hypothetical protein L3J13_10190, partial [Devosiaceae bacterium]|nr:hypothetical protein [Devosiaceae bacterium]